MERRTGVVRRRPRWGFTYIEVATALATTALLAAVITPAIQEAHSTARRIQCLSNGRQLALGVHGFATINDDRVPLLDTGEPLGTWARQILPMIDELPLDLALLVNPDDLAREIPLSVFTCPDDSNNAGQPSGLSYVANTGFISSNLWPNPNDTAHRPDHPDYSLYNGNQDLDVASSTGVFLRTPSNSRVRRSRTTLTRISLGDGLSNTLLLSENVNAQEWWSNSTGNIAFGLNVDTSKVGIGNSSQTALTLSDPQAINKSSLINQNLDSAQAGTSPRPSSNHAGGVQAVFADGHSEFISENVDTTIYARMLTSDGSRFGQNLEIVPSDSYQPDTSQPDTSDSTLTLASTTGPAPTASNGGTQAGDDDMSASGGTSASGPAALSSMGSSINGSITNNTVTNNGTSGVSVSTIFGTTNFQTGTPGFSNNNISGNGGNGVSFEISSGGSVSAGFADNNISDNGASGVSLTSTDSTFDLTVGGPDSSAGNTINNNSGTGVNIDANNSGGTAVVANNTITGTTANTVADGNAISIQGSGTTTFTSSVIDGNTIDGSAGNAVSISIEDDAQINGLSISDNTLTNNAGDGINVFRRDDAVIDGVQINSNTITGNSDGIDILAQNGHNDLLDFSLSDNNIASNSGQGISLRAEADAAISADLTNNSVVNNIGNGIQLTGRKNDITDQENIGGIWSQNVVSNNGGHGVLISSVTGVDSPLIIGQNGNDAAGNSLGNRIQNNGLDGIEINSGGETIIANNIITGNGSAALDDPTQGGGIDINNIETGYRRVEIVNNVIMDNRGDGVEIQSYVDAQGAGSDVNVLMLGNTIESNDGRGVDILNQGDAWTNVRIGDGTITGANDISSNGMEAVYVVNTSSINQTQSVPSTDPLLSDGNVDRVPNLTLDLNTNLIRGNGEGSNFSGTGLVVRVGTSNANAPTFGTASGNNAIANGRVNARVANNTFQGNFGVDALFESFVSTVDPIVTQGTWSDTMFEITDIERDPLARLNLEFTGNTGNSVDVTRGPANGTGVGAFYNNAEPTFKSRTDSQVPPGPFPADGGATRRRNAQRVPGNQPPFNVPNAPAGTGAVGFAYEGVGPSTFRVTDNSSTLGFTGGDSFFTKEPFTDPVITGELPYEWDFVPSGSFSFPSP